MSCRYWEVQVDVGEAVQGWIYWTWKVWFLCMSQPQSGEISQTTFIDGERGRMELSEGS